MCRNVVADLSHYSIFRRPRRNRFRRFIDALQGIACERVVKRVILTRLKDVGALYHIAMRLCVCSFVLTVVASVLAGCSSRSSSRSHSARGNSESAACANVAAVLKNTPGFTMHPGDAEDIVRECLGALKVGPNSIHSLYTAKLQSLGSATTAAQVYCELTALSEDALRSCQIQKTAQPPVVVGDPFAPAWKQANEWPKYEGAVMADPKYRDLWQNPDLPSVLTALSCLLATEGAVPGEIHDRLERLKLWPLTKALFLAYARTGRFPTSFDGALRTHLQSIRSQANLGLWGTYGKGILFDFSALAVLANKTDTTYLRALLTARREGPVQWEKPNDEPYHPYISSELAALERLASLTSLTREEQARLNHLSPPPPGTVEVASSDLWRAYDANEVAADRKFKGKSVLVTGEVLSIDKNAFDQMVLRLDSPNPFMATMATMKRSEEEAVVALSKGDDVRVLCQVTGRVVGVPSLKDCELR